MLCCGVCFTHLGPIWPRISSNTHRINPQVILSFKGDGRWVPVQFSDFPGVGFLGVPGIQSQAIPQPSAGKSMEFSYRVAALHGLMRGAQTAVAEHVHY